MYSISGLPLLVSGGPVTLVTGGEVVMTEPLPTAARALAGTPVTLLATLAGRGVRPVEVGVVVGELIDLTRMKATTMTMTASTLPPVMNRRLRCSARFSAARWAAIFSRAFCCLILVALPIAQSSEMTVWCGPPLSIVGRCRGWPGRDQPPQRAGPTATDRNRGTDRRQ